jgi:hypothetical protein
MKLGRNNNKGQLGCRPAGTRYRLTRTMLTIKGKITAGKRKVMRREFGPMGAWKLQSARRQKRDNNYGPPGSRPPANSNRFKGSKQAKKTPSMRRESTNNNGPPGSRPPAGRLRGRLILLPTSTSTTWWLRNH